MALPAAPRERPPPVATIASADANADAEMAARVARLRVGPEREDASPASREAETSGNPGTASFAEGDWDLLSASPAALERARRRTGPTRGGLGSSPRGGGSVLARGGGGGSRGRGGGRGVGAEVPAERGVRRRARERRGGGAAQLPGDGGDGSGAERGGDEVGGGDGDGGDGDGAVPFGGSLEGGGAGRASESDGAAAASSGPAPRAAERAADAAATRAAASAAASSSSSASAAASSAASSASSSRGRGDARRARRVGGDARLPPQAHDQRPRPERRELRPRSPG